MAFAGRLRSSLPLVSKILRSDSLSAANGSAPQRALLYPIFSDSEFSRNYATATGKKEEKKVKAFFEAYASKHLEFYTLPCKGKMPQGPIPPFKTLLPLALFGGAGNYASALYLASVKANVLDKVESELVDLIEASKKSPLFSQFAKDLSVTKDVRLKAINDICAQAKLSDITKNFLVVATENGRLRDIDTITKKFLELTMAHRGEVTAIVTTVIPLPPEEERELKETLQEIIGQGKKVKLEQKINTSILGGLVVEFGEKVFDMSIRTRARQMERFLRAPIDIGNL
ncbi:ATP synthase subunit O [Morus notabilis]|uniref:ATP synthase subunit O n=1 Tax=Morus notabilis TaxID=981085 RepID=W9QMG5_9ROSA|nr:ATP synthase subunit O [Morus notabilis]